MINPCSLPLKNPKTLSVDIIKVGQDWKGIRIVLEILVSAPGQYEVTVVKSTSSLILKELGPELYERERKAQYMEPNAGHKGNLTLDQVVKIAKIMEAEGKSLAKTFAG